MKTPPRSLVECFSVLPDPRVERTRAHKLIDILVIGLCSVLTGGDSFSDMELLGRARQDWFATFLELPNGVPSHDTFNRVFSALAPERFLECFVTWVQGLCPALGPQRVAIDGKTLRRAADAGEPLPHIVSAWAAESGLALGQVKTSDKSNEIKAIPELLSVLAIKGCIVTIDAMGCQKEIAEQITGQGADYVFALKGNQGTAHDEIKAYFDEGLASAMPLEGQPPGTDFFETMEKGHGRIETRRYWQSTDIGWFQDKALWKGLASAGVVEATRLVKGESSTQRRYYLSSLPLDAEAFARAVRGHWAIENTLHWSMDVVFGEDQSRARVRYAAQNLALLRRIALSLAKQDKTQKRSIRQKRRLAALDPAFLKLLLGV